MRKKEFLGYFLSSVLLMLPSSGGWARESPPPVVDPTSIALNQLPPQGVETYRLIFQGGPFPYEKDGVIFFNRERQLPVQKRGYYHEYTVKTPRSHDRGARRIVCGGALTTPDVCYYSADHYTTFYKIVP